MNDASFEVRLWSTRAIRGKRGTTYRVRWSVDGRERSKTFGTAKLADSFRSQLSMASRAGAAFDAVTGLPSSMVRSPVGPTWLEHAQAFADMKWREASPRHRQSTAEGLTTITLALIASGRSPSDPALARKALRLWSFNTSARAGGSVAPSEFRPVLEWLGSSSRPLADLEDPATIRHILAALGTNLDGTMASPSTLARKRAALSGALGYAVELGRLSSSPLPRIKQRRGQRVEALDSRVVVNPEQARLLLAAIKRRTPALHAYFACLYFAGLRPAEAANLRVSDLTLPGEGWGEILLTGSYQASRAEWTDDGRPGEERGLKHRPRAAIRRVPAAPELVVALREHLDAFESGFGGRLFVTRTGRIGRPVAEPFIRPIGSATTTRVLRLAREDVLTPAQLRSPLARRPYDLRHACVSTWLAAGVAPSQVAAWAGHSVAVLLRVYIHAVDGQEALAQARIEQALGQTRPQIGRDEP